MTKKKLHGPFINHWLRELDAVIRHEIMCYLVECKVIEEGNMMWNGEDFINNLFVCMDCPQDYLEALMEVKNDKDMLKLESMAGSLTGVRQAERFLAEKDFLIQVMDGNQIQDLSIEAQHRLAVTYPLAKDTIERYLKAMTAHEVPHCLRAPKLNEDFRIEDLWHSNDLAKIVKYHLHVIDRVTQQKDT
jgi:hypothetical protein